MAYSMSEPSPGSPPAAGQLRSRTFVGLLVAQFFAAFNDQAIHAAAMFFAINTMTMTERDAIALMPILFYAPWAIFCTIAGYLADRYSKRNALVFWKVAEIGITALACVGFYLGRGAAPTFGPWIVLGTVFLMGMHSAFFVPAKYGVMPEILPPHLLSKGNGILESLSFLAVILGTVTGGVLSYVFQGQEVIIGLLLFGLAIIGAGASALIRKMPAANPLRPFPPYIYGPLFASIRVFLKTKSLRVALAGIAFFTFVVAFMRAAVYMLGESQNPRWDELKTSVVVGTVALGIGLGSPIAGWLSGKRVELRLVLIGACGMIALLIAASIFITNIGILVSCIIGIGFFTGFYIVPLFTLLQHKAPKASKGEMIATSNFINVTGAIASAILFFTVVFVSQKTGLTPEVTDRKELGSGMLKDLTMVRGRPLDFTVVREDGNAITLKEKPEAARPLCIREVVNNVLGKNKHEVIIELAKGIKPPKDPDHLQSVSVSKYKIAGVAHYDIVEADKEPDTDYDLHRLPRFLFLGAAAMTLGILLLLAKPLMQVRREEG
jgi:MFS family permease